MHEWHIVGADATTGKDREISVQAEDEVEAAKVARDAGVFTSSVRKGKEIIDMADDAETLPYQSGVPETALATPAPNLTRHMRFGPVAIAVFLIAACAVVLVAMYASDLRQRSAEREAARQEREAKVQRDLEVNAFKMEWRNFFDGRDHKRKMQNLDFEAKATFLGDQANRSVLRKQRSYNELRDTGDDAYMKCFRAGFPVAKAKEALKSLQEEEEAYENTLK